MDYIIYTDGSYRPSKNQGGYSVVICDNQYNVIKTIFKGIKNTTNNRAELMGLISALRNIPEGSSITIFTDSEYVCNPITKNWLIKWEVEGFKDKKNVDLWKEVLNLLPKYTIDIKWVKGHSVDELNSLADLLAQHASTIELN